MICQWHLLVHLFEGGEYNPNKGRPYFDLQHNGWCSLHEGRRPPLWAIRPIVWDSLLSGGGEWMWDYVSKRFNKMLWPKSALEEGMAILANNGSYSQTQGLDVCGAGWEIACLKSHEILNGPFYKFSSGASTYRGGLLGLVALHTLILRVCQHYHLTLAQGKIICDSKSALNKSRKQPWRIRPGAAQGDVFRALQTIHQEMPGTNLKYEWVKSHQDSQKPW